MVLLYETANSKVYGNNEVVIKEFSDNCMNYVRLGKTRSPAQEAEIQRYMSNYLNVPTIHSYDTNSITMDRLPHILAGKTFHPLLMKELAINLRSVHEAGYVHTDIKRQNLGLDKHGMMSILDWNGATKIGESQITPQYTPKYSALELQYRANLTPQADYYSLACIAFRCFDLTIRPGTPKHKLEEYVRKGTDNWENRQAYVDYINQCTGILPELRPVSLDSFIKICDTLEKPFKLDYEEEESDTIIVSNLSEHYN